jgi:putative membrane protein
MIVFNPILEPSMSLNRGTRAVTTSVFALLSLCAAESLTAQKPAPQRPASEAAKPRLDDPTIVAIFDAANTAEIQTGKLASKRAHSSEIRQFGAMLARDHEMVRQQGRELARKLGVTPTLSEGDRSAQEQAKLLHRLEGLHGAEFDRVFLQHEIEFHRNVIAAVQSTLLPAIENAELKALVVKVAPAFQAHMEMAQNLSQRLAAR